MNSFILTFNLLGPKKYLRLTVDLSIPILMLSILITLAPTTSFLTLFLIPFVIPLLATNFQKIWYASMGRDDTTISPVDFGRYYKNAGLYGALGIGGTMMLSLLLGYFAFSVFTFLFMSPLATAFGKKDVIDGFMTLWTTNQNEALTFLRNNIDELNGTITVLISLAIFSAIVFFFFSLSKSVQGYVLFQRAMPDADKNFMGSQSRLMGRSLLRGSTGLRFRINWFLIFVFTVTGVVLYGGLTALFSLVPSPYPLLTCALPAGITVLLLTPFYTLLLANCVLTADSIMPSVLDKLSEREVAYLESVFHNNNYVHTSESQGQTPFQGQRGAFKGSASPLFYDASKEDGKIADIVQIDKTKEEDKKEDKKEEDSPSFGVLDFSSEQNKDDKNTKE